MLPAKQPAKPADTDAVVNTVAAQPLQDKAEPQEQETAEGKGPEAAGVRAAHMKRQSAPQARKTPDIRPGGETRPALGQTLARRPSQNSGQQENGAGTAGSSTAGRAGTPPATSPEDDAAETLIARHVVRESKTSFAPGSKLDLTLRTSEKTVLDLINNKWLKSGHNTKISRLTMALVTHCAGLNLENHERIHLVQAAFAIVHEVLESKRKGEQEEYKMIEAVEKIARNDGKSFLALQYLAKMFNDGQDWQSIVEQSDAKMLPDSALELKGFVEALRHVKDEFSRENPETNTGSNLSSEAIGSVPQATFDSQDKPESEQEDLSEAGVFKTYFGNSLRAILKAIGEPKKNWAYIIVGPHVTDPAILRNLIETEYESNDLLPWRDLIKNSLDIHINPCEIGDTDEKPYHLIIDNYKNNIREDRVSFFFEFKHQRASSHDYIDVPGLECSEYYLKYGGNGDRNLHKEWFSGICSEISVRHQAALRVPYGDNNLRSWFQERMGKQTADEDDICGAIMLTFISISSRTLRYKAGILTGDDLAHVIKLIDYNKIILKRHAWNVKRLEDLRKEKIERDEKLVTTQSERDKSRVSPGGPDLASMPGLTPELKRKLRRMVRRFKLPSEKPPGLILHGPTGSGKSFIAKRMAFESGRAMIDASISGWESGNEYDQVLKAMTECFAEAREKAPSILFIDEIDGFSVRDPTARNGGGYNAGIVNCFLELMDGQKPRGDIVVIGATNLLDAVDPTVRRHGRLGFEIEIGLPELPQVVELVAFYFPHLDAASVDALAVRIGGGCPPPVIKALADEASGFASDEKEELTDAGQQAAADAIDEAKPQPHHIEQALVELEKSLPSSQTKSSMGFRV